MPTGGLSLWGESLEKVKCFGILNSNSLSKNFIKVLNNFFFNVTSKPIKTLGKYESLITRSSINTSKFLVTLLKLK